MNYRSYLWMVIGAALVVALAVCLLAPAAKATNDPPPTGGTVIGDWTVTDTRAYSSTTIYVQDGNLAIQAGGTLNMSTVTLRFYKTNPMNNNLTLTVEQGGTLIVDNQCTITSMYSSDHYVFTIKGSATINGSTISETWGDISSWQGGVQIYSNTVSVTNNTITNGMTGGISIFDSSPVIACNRITGNGQDGKCATYCYGLYAWNTQSNISSNLIYANNYAEPMVTSPSSYTSISPAQSAGSGRCYYPGTGRYYSSYYAYNYGYYYKYDYQYYSQNIYGTGVIIQGNSNATFYNNSVYKNGYKAPQSPYNYNSGQYDAMYTYCYFYGPYYYGYYYMYYLISYTYINYYYSWSNYGQGLIINDSAVDITGNTFDRNGFEPYHSYYADYNTVCYYSGVDISMGNSRGNITGNTINNAAILVNLTDSRTNLTDNKMLGDFIGTAPDPVSPVSSNVVAWNAVWGVRCNNTQIPNIVNNTITLQYKSYPSFYLRSGTSYYYRGFAASAVALDLGTVKVPTLMQNNKITVDDQGSYGSCPGSCILTDLRANLNFWDNKVEYKRSAMTSGLPNTYLLNAGNANKVNVQNCTFKGPSQALATLPEPTFARANTVKVLGLNCPYGTDLTVLNSSFTGCDYALHASYAAKVTMDGDTFSTGGLALQCLYADTLSIVNTTISSYYVGLQASAAVSGNLINVSFKTCDYAIQETDYSTLNLISVTITGSKTCSLIADGGCKAVFDKCTANGNGIGIRAISSKVTVGNSTFAHASEFFMDKGSTIDVFNSAYTRGGVTLMDMACWLKVYWSVTIKVMWQDEVPIEGAKVTLGTMMGAPIYSGTTGPDGAVPVVLWVKEFEAHNMVITTYTPHRITASKGRVTSMDLYLVDQPLDVVFHLIDTIPPELIVSTPQDNQLFNDSMITVKGKASDQEAGLLEDQIVMNIDNTGWVGVPVVEGAWSFQKPLGDGIHIIQIRAEDLVHNVARTSLSISIDTTGPVLQVFTPVEDSFTNQRTVTVTGLSEDDAFITVNGIQVPVSKRYFSTQISLENGLNTIAVAASDPSGNARSVLVHVTLDNLPPILEITSPKMGAYTNQDPISLIGITEPTALVKVNGVSAQLNGTSFESLVDLSEGANSITVTAVDLAGNLNTLSLVIYMDTVAPDLTVFTPRDELWTNQTKILVTGATEQGASMLINGQNVNVQNTIFSFYANLIEGPNHIEMTAKDAAGNTKTLGRTVYLDSRAPELIVTAPLDRTYTASRVVPVLGSVDFGSEVHVNGERMTVNDFVFSTSLRFEDDGVQVIEFTARDLAGNVATVTRTVTIETVQPFVNITFPVDNTKIPHRMITVTGQTEPGATIVVNTETVVQVGIDGLFSVPVVLEDGVNRITVKAIDPAGNNNVASVSVTKPVAKAETKADMSWALNLTGLLIGIGIALPIATYLITDSRSKTRAKLLAELESAEQERKDKEAMMARKAAMPTVERIGKKKAPREPPKEQPPQEAPKMSTPPVPEAPAAPELAKAGLKDKSGTEEVSAEDTEQASKIEAPKAPSAVEAPETPAQPADATLKDKGTEAEGAAGDTEVAEGVKKKMRP